MPLPKHLFLSDTDGGLYDTRLQDWASKPVRAIYKRSFSAITTTQELKATLRAGQFTFPGGYPLYFVTSDGAALSFESVRKNLRSVIDDIRTKTDSGWRVCACAVNYEDRELVCDHSGESIQSAY